MRLIKKSLLLFVLGIISLLSLTGCQKVDKEFHLEKAEFYVSTDEGLTYNNQTYKVPTNQKVMFKIIINISSNVEENVDFTLYIPHIAEVYYMNGNKLNSTKVNEEDGTIIYNMSIATNQDFEFVFEFNHNIDESKQIVLSFENEQLSQKSLTKVIEFVDEIDK